MNIADSQHCTIAGKELKRSISAMFSNIPGKIGRDSKLIRNYQTKLFSLINLKDTGRKTLQMALCETTSGWNQTRAVFF